MNKAYFIRFLPYIFYSTTLFLFCQILSFTIKKRGGSSPFRVL
nr:MAG TPA: hypothetical protein [Caudoviricetes sp.]